MDAGGGRPAGLVRATVAAACGLLVASAAVIATVWQNSATPSAQYVHAARIESTATAAPIPADRPDTRTETAKFTAAAFPLWVDHGSTCPAQTIAQASRPLWVSHGSVAH